MTVRIGVVGPADEDDFASNILSGLDALGLSGISLGQPTASAFGRRSEAAVQFLRRDPVLGPVIEQGVVRRACELDVSLVITVQSLRPETVRSLRVKGKQVALWFPDHVANLGALWMFDAPYNGLFFKEPGLVRRINSLLKLPVHYLPEACNPRIHRPVDSSEAQGKVVVIGNLHPIRARLLERLATDDIPLAIYGPPAHARLHPALASMHTGRYVRGLEKSAAFCSAAAVLNNLHPAEMEGMNCRLFEAAAAGGAVVSEYRKELGSLFDIGREVLAFQCYDELSAHLRSLLTDPALSRSLGEAASRRSLGNYTYAQRLEMLLERLA